MHQNTLRTIVLLGGLAAALTAAGWLIGPGFAIAGLAIAMAINLGAYYHSDKIVLRMSRARPLERHEAPEIHAMVDDLSRRAGIPAPRVYVTPDHAPNAFATGRDPEHAAIAVTAGLVQHLPARELRGVIAHELAHVKNRDVLIATVAAAMASAISWLGMALSFGAVRDDEDRGGLGALLFVLFAPIGATLVQLGISRSREHQADAEAARFGGDPEGLARALERLDALGPRLVHADPVEPATASLKIANPLSGRGVASWFSTHPPMAERIRRLRAMSAGPAARAATRGSAIGGPRSSWRAWG